MCLAGHVRRRFCVFCMVCMPPMFVRVLQQPALGVLKDATALFAWNRDWPCSQAVVSLHQLVSATYWLPTCCRCVKGWASLQCEHSSASSLCSRQITRGHAVRHSCSTSS
jgi:hypothetical protein